jgi:DNA-binding transcriptional ArsR family regulator
MDLQTSVFKSLADPTRRAVFERLCREGELTVGALALGSGVSQPAISKHLAVLGRARLVEIRYEGRNTHCRARLEGIATLTDWLNDMSGYWKGKLDALDDVLRRMDQ